MSSRISQQPSAEEEGGFSVCLETGKIDYKPDHHHVLIAYDLAPSDTASMDPEQVLGFATEQGSVTSHTAILARSLGIPAIVGLKDAVINVQGLSMCIPISQRILFSIRMLF